MPRKKRQRFEEVNSSPHVLSYLNNDVKKEIAQFIKDKQKVILEVGCGRGEYTIGLAKENQQNGYIGLDIQGERLWFGMKNIVEEKIDNVIFIRGYAYHLEKFFPKNCVDEIWLTFPDPFPKKGDIKKRLMSPRFLKIYKNICKKNYTLHLKTDNKKLFQYAKEVLHNEQNKCSISENIDIDKKINKEATIVVTEFEKKFRKKDIKIKYLECKMNLKKQ